MVGGTVGVIAGAAVAIEGIAGIELAVVPGGMETVGGVPEALQAGRAMTRNKTGRQRREILFIDG